VTEIVKDYWIRASLSLRGFGDDPQVITELLGLIPTFSGRAGDQIVAPNGRVSSFRSRRAYWSLHSRCAPTALLSEHVADILEQLGDAARALSNLPVGATATLFCTVIPDDDLPVLAIGSELLQKLGSAGVNLEIDLIRVEEPADE
jgi:hypothetical protein